MLAHRAGNAQRGIDRTLGIICVRLRQAEIGEQAVADGPGYHAAVFLDLPIADVAILAQEREKLLGVQALAQRGRFDDVDEYDRQLTALRRSRRRRGLRRWGLRRWALLGHGGRRLLRYFDVRPS